MYINAVKHRSGNFGKITLDLLRRGGQVSVRIFQRTCRTWVHCGYEHKAGWIPCGYRDSRNGNFPVFKRLAQYLKSISGKFGQFIKKQNTVVRKAYLPRFCCCPTTNESDITRCMVGVAEWSCHHQWPTFFKQVGYRIDFSGFK